MAREEQDISIVAGLLVRGQLRRYLDKMRFRKKVQDYYEGPGFLEREFIIVGADGDVRQQLENWVRVVNE